MPCSHITPAGNCSHSWITGLGKGHQQNYTKRKQQKLSYQRAEAYLPGFLNGGKRKHILNSHLILQRYHGIVTPCVENNEEVDCLLLAEHSGIGSLCALLSVATRVLSRGNISACDANLSLFIAVNYWHAMRPALLLGTLPCLTGWRTGSVCPEELGIVVQLNGFCTTLRNYPTSQCIIASVSKILAVETRLFERCDLI